MEREYVRAPRQPKPGGSILSSLKLTCTKGQYIRAAWNQKTKQNKTRKLYQNAFLITQCKPSVYSIKDCKIPRRKNADVVYFRLSRLNQTTYGILRWLWSCDKTFQVQDIFSSYIHRSRLCIHISITIFLFTPSKRYRNILIKG